MGAFRFNTDSMKLEIFRGADVGIGTLAAGQWEEIQATSPDVQTGELVDYEWVVIP